MSELCQNSIGIQHPYPHRLRFWRGTANFRFYDGSLYLYNATGFDLPKEYSWELLGQVVSVNNLEWPSEDFAGTHLNIGQEIYWEPSEPQKLYVKYDNGFALFEAE